MPLRLFRFRRFSSRLLALLLALLVAALTASFWLVLRANRANARAHAVARLEVGARVFDEAARQRIEALTDAASAMTGDYAIRALLLENEPDARTLASTLQSYVSRVNAPIITLFDPEGALLASSAASANSEDGGGFRSLIDRAAEAENERAHGFARLKGELHVLVVVPLYAPYPHIAAWFGLAFPIDHAFARRIEDIAQLAVTFATIDDSGSRVLATTLSSTSAEHVAAWSTAAADDTTRTDVIEQDGQRHVTLRKVLPTLNEEHVWVVLQRPLAPELAVARALEADLLLIAAVAMIGATIAALGLARSVTRPVRRLAAHTRVIAAGNYTTPLTLERADELGDLARSFNAMSAGLAERDRVRDLLDKNVSPSVAAQLLRDGTALGGEEREVTILFVDLRGFTTLSERVTPRDLVTLLNRYLDRMSAAIEQHGGIIDKFIGDAIMALFGAPVAQPDGAARAVTSALAMQRALGLLNAELAQEGVLEALGLRGGLELGIGINTARVIAGNMGSTRRLNYSVVGDGVNIAARLQTLTRNPEYEATILATAATVTAAVSQGAGFVARPLDAVQVRGRAERVEVFAIEARTRGT